jgi:nitrous oxide reductase
MKQPQKPSNPGAAAKKDLSRRKFLHSAAVAGAAAVTLPFAGNAQSATQAGQAHADDPMASALTRYGSELGNLKLIR